ncbi:MAG: tRNA (adenosine(37)-N6)-threonylcarbamoyltransferase complex dimerization subunit type 1 TsaB, partial [Clostridia bacterium]|nr:tRNA (adenosine(37)-N6)-threonylcarbamoyltransferase complex dimerization subunit type 1 TsaB [Clostridia bacterium]
MKILAFDSTAKTASVAVSENDRILAAYNVDNGLTQSELLLPMAEAMLKNLGITFSDIDAYAVNAGPGSFTGVRIGVSLVKGLAFSRGCPCIPVSTLESLAENLRGLCGIVVPVMDARRNQVYTAIFRSDAQGITRLSEDTALPLPELYERLSEFNGEPIYLVGDGYKVAEGALSSMNLSGLMTTPEILIMQNAASTARVAYAKHECGEYT